MSSISEREISGLEAASTWASIFRDTRLPAQLSRLGLVVGLGVLFACDLYEALLAPC